VSNLNVTKPKVSKKEKKQVNAKVMFGLVLLGVVNLGPLLWGLMTSIRPRSEIFSYPPSFMVGEITGEHYSEVLSGNFPRSLLTSLIYAGSATIIAVVIGALAAYGFDRFEFRFRSSLFGVIVACIPLAMGAAVLVIPNYLYFASIGLLNKPITLPILYLGYNLPMAIWILKGAMEGIPHELDESATIDGASRFRTFWSIILPLCRPSMAAAALFVFIGSWNEFVAGSVMVNSAEYRPVQVSVYNFISVLGRQWGPLTASAILALIPVIILVVFFGRQLVAGLMRGAVKG